MTRNSMADYYKWLNMMLHKDMLTKEEVEQILNSQLDLPENKMDIDLIEECMQLLYPEYEKRNGIDMKAHEFAVKLVRQNTDQDDPLNISGHISSRLRPTAILLPVIMGIMLLGTVIAYAMGYPIWNYVLRWGEEQVRIDINIQALSNSHGVSSVDDYFGLGKGDDFDEKLKELQMDPVLPRLPEQYALIAVDSSGDDVLCNIIGLYGAEDVTLHISITKVGDVNAALGETIEKDGNDYERIEIGETSYYLFNNLDTSEVIWVSPPYIIQLGGNIAKDELLSMINK